MKNSKNITLTHPKLAKQWHPILNGDKKPEDFSFGSPFSAAWLCNCGKIFYARIKERTKRKSILGCPICSNRKISKENSLANRYPEIAIEWDYEENHPLTPHDVVFGCGKTVGWICSICKNKYKSRILNRTRNKTGCRPCHSHNSIPEMFIYSQFKWIFPDAKNRHKIGRLELDCYSESVKIAIEIDGYWHKDRLDADRKKDEIIKSYGITLIRLRDSRLPKINENDNFSINLQVQQINLDIIKKIFSFIRDIILAQKMDTTKLDEYLKLDCIPNLDFYETIKNDGLLLIPKNNITITYPNLCKDWDHEANGYLKPENISHGSHKPIGWKCHVCETKWITPVYNRAAGDSPCPQCGTIKNQERRKIAMQMKELSDQGLSMAQIAKKTNYARCTVWTYLKKLREEPHRYMSIELDTKQRPDDNTNF